MNRTSSFLFGGLLYLSIIAFVKGQQCVSPSSVVYYARNSKVYLNNTPLDIKGVAWFGFEGPGWTIEGLGSASANSILDFLQANQFNALRIPFSADMIIQNRSPTGYINYQLNPDMQGLTSVQIMSLIIDKAAARGILVLPDLHRFDPSNSNLPYWYSVGCIYNANGVCYNYSESVVTNMWISLINLLKGKWNVMGMDLLNEPHEYNSTYDGSTWGTGASSDWDAAAIRISNAVYQQTGWTRGLTFVEGIGDTPSNDFCESRNYGHWWGGNLEPVRCKPLSGNDMTRYVYSPHVYGPSVFQQPYFSRSDFPANMRMIWEADFGFVPGYTNQPLVIGEWGGPVNGQNQVWQEAFINFLIDSNIRDTFYWALNPPYSSSADTTGVLNGDWMTGNQPVLNEIKRLQPSPSIITATSSQVCVVSQATSPVVVVANINGVAATATASNSQSVAGSPIVVGPLWKFNTTASSYRLLSTGQYENLLTGLEVGINNNMGAGSSLIVLPKDNSNNNQKWTYNSGTKTIVNNGNSNLVWDLRSASTSIGNPVIVWNPNSGQNQQYNLVPMAYWTGQPVAGVSYYIISRSNGLVLDINGGNLTPGSYVNLYTMKLRYNTYNQNFLFTNLGELQVSTTTNIVLDARIDGTNLVDIWTRNSGINQQWRYDKTSENIINGQNLVLDFNSNNNVITAVADSTRVQQRWWLLAYSSEF